MFALPIFKLAKKRKIFGRLRCASGGFGLCPQTPSLRRLGVSPPDPHWPPAAGGSAPRPSKQPPHCEFLATHLQIYIVNHHLAFYKQADESFIEVPNSFDCKQGWLQNQNDLLGSSWQGGPILS